MLPSVSDHFGTFRITLPSLRSISDQSYCPPQVSELFGSPFSHENAPNFFLRGDVFSKLDLAPSESKSKCPFARIEQMRLGRSWARTTVDVAATDAPDRVHRMHRWGARPAARRLPLAAARFRRKSRARFYRVSAGRGDA
jgi:hypothetical protein